MCKFFVPPFFYILLLCIIIGLSMSVPKKSSLSEDPKIFCHHCKELANSDRFQKMISELQQKMPIESRNLVWDKNATLLYSKLLPVLSRFMDKVKMHTKVLMTVKGPHADPWREKEYQEADEFLNQTHPVSINI
jgi:hypothetical protein